MQIHQKILILNVLIIFFCRPVLAADVPDAEPPNAPPQAMLGINIASATRVAGAVEGVRIVGVTPGTPAAEAGLQPNDVIVAIDDTNLTATSVDAANARLLEYMQTVAPGQQVVLHCLRDGRVLKVELVAGAWEPGMLPPDFPFRSDLENLGRQFESQVLKPLQSRWRHYGIFAGMELVALTPQLGRYFGTDQGLLVVRAPTSGDLGLEDGDVIVRIGDRRPRDPEHAMRILRSYDPGEELVIDIVREQRERELRVTLRETDSPPAR